MPQPPNPDVNAYAAGLEQWREEFELLRKQLLALPLTEEVKWRKPCYSSDGANIVIFQPFKNLCALMFFRGAILDDPEGLLREQGPNSQSALRLEFRSPDDVRAVRTALPRLVHQAIANARDGIEVPRPKTPDPIPDELLDRFDEDPRLREAWEELTPGRQRGYLLHFGAAKQAATRYARIDRHRDRILDGLGMHD